MSTSLRWLLVAGSALAVLAMPVPTGISPESWHLLAIFTGTIVGSIVRPVPAGAVVFLGVAALAITKTMPAREALAGYADPLVWLVLCAFFMSRGVLNTGLGRRIAYLFIRAIGKNSLGLAYALTSTDALLAGFLPSNSARCGGVIFPIARSLAEAYESKPGATARRLGAFLLITIYQSDVIACAMFLTGQASNVIVAKLAMETTKIDLSYSKWLLGSSVPGLLSLAFIPWLLFKLYPPEVTHTPDATRLAKEELARIGPMQRNERMMLFVFVLVSGLWMTGPLHHIDYAVVALLGVCLLFLTNVLTWDDIISERGAWDVFLWYGGVVRMAEAVGRSGLTERFAQSAAGLTTGLAWGAALAILLLIYFYAHYGFASITAHVTAMFVPFAVVLMAAGAPPLLTVIMLAYFSNLSASLTHYGTTTAPIYFGANYVSQRDWWRLGLYVSFATITIWTVAGLAWWKVLGWW
ncbi:MAG: DASS family sodium-coupled anion symporter [Gemmatimonadetes bacterium]|nr:DASS family sodium-coupled anion symporter [Gemmatimonadota bacterium]